VSPAARAAKRTSLNASEHRPWWPRADRRLGEHVVAQDTPARVTRQEFERHLERRRLEEVDEAALAESRRAWSIGAEAFRQQCPEKMEGGVGEDHPGRTRLGTAEAKADRIVAEELARLRWTLGDLAPRQKSDATKPALADRLRQEATLSLKRTAERLRLGRPKGARTNLDKFMNRSAAGASQPRFDF
jgi:hypothetical protein